jgi:uncharacterized membrane protein YhfC
MTNQIPTANIFALIIASILIVVIWVALIMFANKKLNNIVQLALFAGIIVWFVAVQIERIFHYFLLPLFNSNIFSYAIYGGIMAGLFEETGRLLCFLNKLKPSEYNKNNSLYYGIGHGGFEAFYLVTFNNIIILIFCILINKGKYDEYLEKEQEKTLTDFETQLLNTMKTIYKNYQNSHFFNITFLVVWERISAIIYHISASVIVWYAAIDFPKNVKLYYLAIGMHFSFDCFIVIFHYFVGKIFITEIFAFNLAIVCALIGFKCWKYFENNIEIKQNLMAIESIESISPFNQDNSVSTINQ